MRAVDPSLLAFSAHGRARQQVVEFIGNVNGLRQAERCLRHRVTARTRRRFVHLDVAAAVLRHISSASIAELQQDIRRESGGHDVVPPCDDVAGYEMWEVVADACDVEGSARRHQRGLRSDLLRPVRQLLFHVFHGLGGWFPASRRRVWEGCGEAKGRLVSRARGK